MENENEAINSAAPGPQAVEQVIERRIIAGLQEGRLVNYVMRDLSIRPLLIVNARDRSGLVNGVLFFDGPSDAGLHPIPMETEHSGFIPYTVRNLKAVPYDDAALVPGSWHWPQKQPVVAAALDNAALEQIVESLTESVMQRAKLALDAHTELVTDKLSQTVESVNDSLNSHSEMIKTELPKTITLAVKSMREETLPTSPVPSPEELAGRAPIGGAISPETVTTSEPGPSVADLDAHAAEQDAKAATTEPEAQDAAKAGS